MTLTKFSSLSDLYKEDTKDSSHTFLFPYPATGEWSTFPNKEKFLIQDGGKDPVSHNVVHKKEAWRHAAILGDTLPGIVTEHIPELLLTYWKDTFGHHYKNIITLPEATYMEEINKGTFGKMLTLFPYEHLKKEMHAVDPDSHYKVLSKKALMEMDIPTPAQQSISLENMAMAYDEVRSFLKEHTAAVLKTPHGLSGDGTWIIKNQEDLATAMEKVQFYHTHGKMDEVIIQECIDYKNNFGAGFYVDKQGNMTVLGCNQQVVDAEGHFQGGMVDYNLTLPEEITVILKKAAAYLHENGYFGVAGLDILEGMTGEYFVIDGNIRLTGSLSLYVLQEKLKKLGISHAQFSTELSYEGSLDNALSTFKNELKEQKIVILSALEGKMHTEIYGIITGKDGQNFMENKKYLAQKGLLLS